MITIEINNVEDIIESEKGVLVSKLGSKIINFKKMVEKRVVKEIEKSLEEKGIKAELKIK